MAYPHEVRSAMAQRVIADLNLVEKCDICEEPLDGEIAEMHDADMLADPDLFSEAGSGIVHAQCGLNKGWVIS